VPEIKIDDLTDIAVQNLLLEHQNKMAENSPPESCHVLDIQALQQPGMTFFTMRDDDHLMGCVALKHWDNGWGEIKSMKTVPGQTGKGIGSGLLEHVIAVAKERGYLELKLETGSMEYFKPARKLYSKYGFEYCDPFAQYVPDVNSVFMCLTIE